MIEFRNEPFTNFADPANKEAMRAALAKVKSELGQEYPLVTGGEKLFTEKKKQIGQSRKSGSSNWISVAS